MAPPPDGAPHRAARLWLAVAVDIVAAQRRWGGRRDAPASTLLDVTVWCPERPRTRRATRLRLVSVFRQGWVGSGRPAAPGAGAAGRLVPEPWPAVPPLAGDPDAPEVVLPEAA